MDLPSTATSETTAKSTSPRTSRKIKVSQDPTLGTLPPPPAEPQALRVESNPVANSERSAEVAADVAPVGAIPLENFGPLPATYHQDTLFLTARDPRWLFAYWDFDWGRVPVSRMRDGRCAYFLKVTRKDGLLESLVEINPGARNWYVPVSTAGMCYVAELGYFELSGGWCALAQSGEAYTPADVLAPEGKDEVFATVPQTLTFAKLQELVEQHMEDGETLLGAIARITGEGRIQVQRGVAPTWSPEQKRLLAMLLGESLIDAVGLGSEEIDRLLRKALQQKLHSEAASGLGARLAAAFGPSSFHLASLFSPMGASWSKQPFGAGRERGFFMHLNAEVIFYGGTQPDARVTVNGEAIQLQPDGTFRYHFTLPDGEFEIPICATSADGQEERSGTLSFRRETRRVGAVGATAQPQHLEPLMGRRTA